MSDTDNAGDKMREDARAAAEEAKSDLRQGARKVAEDIRETASHLADNAGFERLKERGAEFADQARQTGRDYAERARAGAERVYADGQRRADDVAHYAEARYDELSDMVRRHPAQSLGIAAGIGFLVGLILARR